MIIYKLLYSKFRLILYLQLIGKYADQQVTGLRYAKTPLPAKTNTSVGLVVKKIWNKIVQSHGMLTQYSSEVRNSKGM